MEFQKRNAPHFHIFLTVPPNYTLLPKIAKAWVRASNSDGPDTLLFHSDRRNWIDWNMGNGNYLCKYLDKDAQKFIPPGYLNFGRFWGNSQRLLTEPIVIPLDTLDNLDTVNKSTGEFSNTQAKVLRWLGRLADKQTKKYSRFRQRAPHGSYTMLQGTSAYFRIEKYLSKEKNNELKMENSILL